MAHRPEIIFILIFNQINHLSGYDSLSFPNLAQNLRIYGQEIIEMEIAMVIYLDQYRKAKAANVIAARSYDQEKLCINGSFTTGAIAMPRKQNSIDLSPELPEDFTQVDIDAFCGRIYALASQI